MKLRIVKVHSGYDNKGNDVYSEYLEYLDENLKRWVEVPVMSRYEANQQNKHLRKTGELL